MTAGLPQSLTVSGSDIQTDYAGYRTHTTYHSIKAYLVCITAASLLFGIYLYYINKYLLLHVFQWSGQNELICCKSAIFGNFGYRHIKQVVSKQIKKVIAVAPTLYSLLFIVLYLLLLVIVFSLCPVFIYYNIFPSM